MESDEAVSTSRPQSNLKSSRKPSKNEKVKKVQNTYFLAVLILFVLVIAMCSYTIAVYDSYKDLKLAFEINSIPQDENVPVSDSTGFEAQNELLKKELEEIRAANEDLISRMNKLEKQNDELVKKNRELTEDNIELQNTLKMAASAGIKPQNYTRFDGLEARGEIKRGTYLGKFLGTAYTPSKSECGNDKGITHSGKPIIPGVSLAVDGKYWPFGTVFYIRGLGYAVAMDTGSAIKGKKRFDFAVFDRKFAIMLGERHWDVYLVKMGNGKVEEINF